MALVEVKAILSVCSFWYSGGVGMGGRGGGGEGVLVGVVGVSPISVNKRFRNVKT